MTARAAMPRMIRAWLVDEHGAAAVEFALVALPFIALLMATVQLGMVYLAGQVLQAATMESSRMVMTGRAQGMTPAQFQQSVCDNGHAFFDCSQLAVNVQTYTSFASVTSVPPIKKGKLDPSTLGFQTGSPGQIEVVQVYYPWPLGTDLLGLHLVDVNGDSHLLTATAVFRNEPY
jgi:Flp pilus assembly protein TadG